jgi:hypothetical protein
MARLKTAKRRGTWAQSSWQDQWFIKKKGDPSTFAGTLTAGKQQHTAVGKLGFTVTLEVTFNGYPTKLEDRISEPIGAEDQPYRQ